MASRRCTAVFGISYDVTPQNFPLLQLPPQLQTEQNPDITCTLRGSPAWCANYLGGGPGTGFLAGGGLLQVNVPPATQAEARAATQGIILDQVQPKVLTWTLGIQREIMDNTNIEFRYLGTRATQLPVQARINTISAFNAGLQQPLLTFFSASQVPATILGGSRLSQFESFGEAPFIHPEFSLMTAFPVIGSSTYHAGSVDFNRRFARCFMLRSNYTFAKNIDDATNELFNSRVNPRRPFDYMHLGLDRGRSVLDVRHKFALSWIYEFPKPDTGSGFLNTLVQGWQWNATYLAQSRQPVSILSIADANADFDNARDRAILNPAGVGHTGTAVNYVCVGLGGVTSIASILATNPCSGSANVAGYVAQNPSTRYVQAEMGAMPTLGRNSFGAPG